MSSRNLKNGAVALTFTLLLSACGSTAPKISESDILAAERNGTLQSLYAQIKGGTGRGKGLKAADQAAYLKKIGTRLASQTTQKILSTLNSARLPGNQVPVSTLDEAMSTVETMRSWDSAQYETTLNTLNEEIAITQSAIESTRGTFDGINPRQIANKQTVLNELRQLYGGANRSELDGLQNQMYADVYDYVDQLIGRRDFNGAIDQLKALVAVAPNYRDVKQKLENLATTALQDTFVSYVRDGETEKAREMLDLIAKGQYFAQQKAVIQPSAIELANYYVAMAVEATSEENLVDAYRLFSEARAVKGIFDMPMNEVTEESDFIDFVYQLYEEAFNKKSYGLALGYLSVIEQMRPEFPELDTFKRVVNENVMNAAVKRVSTTAFNADDHTRSLGRSIASKITQYVFDTLPKDVRVVEREQLNAVLREQEISALKQGTGVQIDSADLLIQGTILEANVETTKTPTSRRERVVVERKEVPQSGLCCLAGHVQF